MRLQSIAINDCRDYIQYERFSGAWLHWSVKGIFQLQELMEMFIAENKRLCLQGIPVEIAIWRGDGSLDMSLSTVGTWLMCH